MLICCSRNNKLTETYIFLMHIILLCTYTFFQDSYTVPLTSIQCWHVHCEECWLHTLVRWTCIILYLTKDFLHNHVTSTSILFMLFLIVKLSWLVPHSCREPRNCVHSATLSPHLGTWDECICEELQLSCHLPVCTLHKGITFTEENFSGLMQNLEDILP